MKINGIHLCEESAICDGILVLFFNKMFTNFVIFRLLSHVNQSFYIILYTQVNLEISRLGVAQNFWGAAAQTGSF